MYTGIFDSHAHYDDPRFEADRAEKLAELFAGGLVNLMNIGADLPTSRMTVELAEKYPPIYGAVGIHPGAAEELPPDYLAQLEELATSCPKVRAIGEIGLDYHYPGYSKERQFEVFIAQLELARRLELPVVIHSREAPGDTLEILKAHPTPGVVHCFSGSAELARQLVQLGYYIGFTGVVTFKNARKALEAAAAVPLDRLLIETDCPYLAPEPYRGSRCDSLMLGGVVDTLAGVKEISPEELVRQTAENARRLFRIEEH